MGVQQTKVLVRDDGRFLELLREPKRVRVEIGTLSLHRRARTGGFDGRVRDEHVLNLILSGRLRAGFAGATRVLGPGSLIWLPPGVPHSFRFETSSGGYRMCNCRFRLLDGDRNIGFADHGFAVDDAASHRHLFELLLDDRQTGHSRSQERFLSALFLLYSDLIEQRRRRGPILDRDRRRRLEQYAQQHAGTRATPRELARVVGLSEDYFRRAFARTYRCSPRRWLLRERIRLAADRLLEEPELSVQAVAHAFGYAELFLFSRQFKEVMGVSPTGYRARHR